MIERFCIHFEIREISFPFSLHAKRFGNARASPVAPGDRLKIAPPLPKYANGYAPRSRASRPDKITFFVPDFDTFPLFSGRAFPADGFCVLYNGIDSRTRETGQGDMKHGWKFRAPNRRLYMVSPRLERGFYFQEFFDSRSLIHMDDGLDLMHVAKFDASSMDFLLVYRFIFFKAATPLNDESFVTQFRSFRWLASY